MYSPLTHLSFTYAALKSSQGAVLPRLPGASPGDEANPEQVRRMAEHLCGLPPEAQKQLLRVLTMKAMTIPWSLIHPTWIGHLMQEWPAQWRLWALECLPGDSRERLKRRLPPAGKTKIIEGVMPRWWTIWLSNYVKRRLGYPDLPPAEKTHSDADLPGSLCEMSDAELAAVLRLHGTAGLVSCIRKLPRSEAQQLMWQLPAELQTIATAIIQSKKWLDDPFWPVVYKELEKSYPSLAKRVTRMAVADWLRCGLMRGQGLHLRRLAYRLPRSVGQFALDALAGHPEWLSTPVQPSIDEWIQRLRETLQELNQTGQIRVALADDEQSK
ncbi:MAG: hypothetical protein AB1714_03710 [Acidobacteriota bacterium]